MDKLEFSPELKESWLVQRLEKPRTGTGLATIANAFSFGGGLANGGLSKEGMAAINTIFSFDYMGSAEFEWGIVPSCLSFLAQNSNKLISKSMRIGEDKPTLYYICHTAHANQIEERLKLLATNPPRAQESVDLAYWYTKGDKSKEDYKSRVVAWLDCSNGFLFFVDKEMAMAACKLFEVTPDWK